MSAEFDVSTIIDFAWNAGIWLGLLIGLCAGLIASPILARMWNCIKGE